MNYVLIIALLSPGGDYMDKIPVVMQDQKSCQQAIAQLPKQGENPWGMQFRGTCVSMAHWTGKKKDKGVNFD